MWDAVSDAFGEMITLVGSFLTALLSGGLSGLLPLFAIGIAISLVMVAVKINFTLIAQKGGLVNVGCRV